MEEILIGIMIGSITIITALALLNLSYTNSTIQTCPTMPSKLTCELTAETLQELDNTAPSTEEIAVACLKMLRNTNLIREELS